MLSVIVLSVIVLNVAGPITLIKRVLNSISGSHSSRCFDADSILKDSYVLLTSNRNNLNLDFLLG
jgi:hypothetical protein